MKCFLAFALTTPLLLAQPVPGHYIVELAAPPATTPAARKGPRRAQAQADQQRVRHALEARSVRVLDSVETVANALLVYAPEGRLTDLATTPGVARVYPVFYLQRTVDRALALHKINDAVQRLASPDPGAGVKIAILDTGIDNEHPAFQDGSLATPEGFPRAGRESDLAFTNHKIIVARSYAGLLGGEEEPARDADGHGTAVGMIAAGVAHEGVLGPISGVAPKAWLGNYKVFGSRSELTRSDVVLKALDDAVADGMDVVNLSLSAPVSPHPAEDALVAAVERAVAAGVLVITSAGNLGPDPNTVGSPGNAPGAITVGASWNTRIFAGSLTPKDSKPYVALPVRYEPHEPVSGFLADVSQLDSDGTACQELPEASLAGRVALVAYGGCRFEQKLVNARRAGALAAVIYAETAAMDSTLMAAGQAALPASIIRLSDGRELQSRLEADPALEVTLQFGMRSSTVSPDELAYFSSRGPVLGDAIKPDLVAAGMQLLIATQNWEPRGDMYAPSGYAVAQGTSFSAPLVAGAAAVLKAARPGLSVLNYRSLLINTASALSSAPVQHAGAGSLNLDAALRATLTVSPASLSFAAGSTRVLSVSSLGPSPVVLSFSVVRDGDEAAPSLSASELELEPGTAATVTLTLATEELPAGVYQGYLGIRDAASETALRVPYWYAVASPEPGHITLLSHALQGVPGSTFPIPFRLSDPAGFSLSAAEPAVTALAGGGQVLAVGPLDPFFPGVWYLGVRLGGEPGNNVFRIEAGGLRKEVVIEARAQ